VCDEVLRSPLVLDSMGEDWSRATTGGFLRGEPRATQQAMLACGPFALGRALREAA
jgi:hypothetical protein